MQELQSVFFAIMFFSVWIVFVVSGGIMGALFGWIPAFIVADMLAEYAGEIIVLIALVLFTVYAINLSHGYAATPQTPRHAALQGGDAACTV